MEKKKQSEREGGRIGGNENWVSLLQDWTTVKVREKEFKLRPG